VTLAVRQLAEIEAASKKASEDHKENLKSAERRVKELEGQIERNHRTSSETSFLQKRIAEELEAERERHRKDLAEHDLKSDQARTRYQSMIRLQHHHPIC
jgi:anaerobic ribonucleoside-triphosphate reductase